MKTVCALLILLASVVALAQPQPETLLDVHQLVARSNAANNQLIAICNRLIAHLQKAQTWEGIDADHPDAVALRAQITQEKNEFLRKADESSEVDDQLTAYSLASECTPEEYNEWVRLMKEVTPIIHELTNQFQRYHALGY